MRLVRGHDLRRIFALVKDGDDAWSQTRALGVLLKVCETLAYAHAKGVIHRDLKPANVMVGRFGEVYVMDWGLARVLGRDDARAVELSETPESLSAVWTERHDERSNPDASLATLDGSVLGTPSYMPPEQALGQVDGLDRRADVYAVGAMLYELLVGRAPYQPGGGALGARTVLLAVVAGPPEPVASLAPHSPPELVAICEKAMQRDREDRYVDTLAMAEDLRAYLENRVVRAHRTGAAIEFRKWVERNQGTAWAAAAGLAALLLGLVVSVRFYLQASGSARDVLSLATSERLAELRTEADGLWPIDPGGVRAARGLARPRERPGRRPRAVRGSSRDGTRSRLARTRRQLELRQPRGRLVASTADRAARGLQTPSPTPRRAGSTGWFPATAGACASGSRSLGASRARASMAPRPRRVGPRPSSWRPIPKDRTARRARPSFGASSSCPSGRIRRAGLLEFAHVATGEVPERDADGALLLGPEHALVLVLVPGGELLLGAQADAPGEAGFDAMAEPDEAPLVEVDVQAFLIGKHELTQAQWERLDGENPSEYQELVPSKHPVESIDWFAARRVLGRVGLELPTEARWEFAARAGHDGPWWTGAEERGLQRSTNLASRAAAEEGGNWAKHRTWYVDGWAVHAPADALEPNPLGLHHVLGNVWEWCADAYGPYGSQVEGADARRVHRGGSFVDAGSSARASNRNEAAPTVRSANIGVRAAMSLSPR